MKEIIIPKTYNYIAIFLTLRCNLRCSYCINSYESKPLNKNSLAGPLWVKALNKISSRDDLPITLQGGEPSLHNDFIYIINNIKQELNIDILTNLQFDIKKFARMIDPKRLQRDSPYASIRVSYHPETMDLMLTVNKVLDLFTKGFSIGIWAVDHPSYQGEINRAKVICKNLGIDFRLKEFLDKNHGTYKYPNACDLNHTENVQCRTSELILGPFAEVYRCHSDLYAGREAVGSLLDDNFELNPEFRPCNNYGHCNPCDVKTKTNRFQIFGHTSVEIIK